MLRITAGEFKGRLLKAPAHSKTRPTQAKLRQALFNSLQAITPGSQVLDLFAGSGALGFEALSRGAEKVVFVESSSSVAEWIKKNAESLGVLDRVQIKVASVESIQELLQKWGPFDLILADPPYDGRWELKMLEMLPWKDILSPDGYFCLEWSHERGGLKELPSQVPFLVKVREKHYGDSMLTTYKREADEASTGHEPVGHEEGRG